MREDTINKNFKYHKPTEESIDDFVEIRNSAKNFALLLTDLCPESRELSLALTKLEESVMWANASIARNKIREIGK